MGHSTRIPDRPSTECFSPGFGSQDIEIIQAVEPSTMTGLERLFALIQTIRYIVAHEHPRRF